MVLAGNPTQVPLSHIGFAPTEEEAATANSIVEEFSRAEADGTNHVKIGGRIYAGSYDLRKPDRPPALAPNHDSD